MEQSTGYCLVDEAGVCSCDRHAAVAQSRMANVLPFVARTSPALDPVAAARTTASVIGDLVQVVAEVKEISGRVLPLPNDAQEIERTLQALLDAISAIEHATDVLTHYGERTPF